MKDNLNNLETLKHLAKPFYIEGGEVGVLLVHGFTASPTETLPLGRFLHEKGYTVHGVLLAGHGTDYQELPKFSWQDWYQSVESGFDHLKDRCKSVILIGVSLGALLCLNLAYQHSEAKISKLGLLAPPFALKSKLIKLIPLLKFFVRFIYKGEDTLQYFKEHNLYSYMYRPTASVVQLTRFLKHIQKQTVRISIPTLIAYGALDDMIAIPAILDAQKQKFSPEAKVITLELLNSGHILTVEPDSEKLFQKIVEFLEM